MTQEMLSKINNLLVDAGINYSFMQRNDEPEYPYFVGEYLEVSGGNEDEKKEATFILNGWTRGPWLELENAKSIIIDMLKEKSTGILQESGNGYAIMHDNSMPVHTGDAELKKIQINLKIYEWKVN